MYILCFDPNMLSFRFDFNSIVDEREIENSKMIEDRRKAVEDLDIESQLRELGLTRLLEESNSQLQRKVGVEHSD